VLRLQSANPKGRLLEWCAQKKWAPPRFEQQADSDGYRVRAVLSSQVDESIMSGWYSAAALKSAEQAAAEAVLGIVSCKQASDEDHVPPQPSETTQVHDQNAAMRLNELKQVGLLQDFGYDVVDQEGPSHQPVFSMVAWGTGEDGQRWTTEPVRTSSKKSCQRAAAERLLDLLVEHGITRSVR
jgi:dsRNA-specific ribonuclease